MGMRKCGGTATASSCTSYSGRCFTAGGSLRHVKEKLLKLRVVLDYLRPRIILPHGFGIAERTNLF